MNKYTWDTKRYHFICKSHILEGCCSTSSIHCLKDWYAVWIFHWFITLQQDLVQNRMEMDHFTFILSKTLLQFEYWFLWCTICTTPSSCCKVYDEKITLPRLSDTVYFLIQHFVVLCFWSICSFLSCLFRRLLFAVWIVLFSIFCWLLQSGNIITPQPQMSNILILKNYQNDLMVFWCILVNRIIAWSFKTKSMSLKNY